MQDDTKQTQKHGMTKMAVMETIRICKDRDILREYLAQREKEVVTIMMSLFDEEQVMRSYIKSERYEETMENARRLLKLGIVTTYAYTAISIVQDNDKKIKEND